MSRSKHTEAQMIAAVKQMEAGRKAEDVAREVGVSAHTIYAWKSKYGGMDVSEAQEAKRLRDENARLKKLVADLSLDKEALQSVIEKNGWCHRDSQESCNKKEREHSSCIICNSLGQTLHYFLGY
jgi:putative transposase